VNESSGLTVDHFGFFAQRADARSQQTKDEIRQTLNEFARRVIRHTGTTWHPHMLNMWRGATNAGVVIEPGARGQNPHLTIEINSAEINIFANIELQSPHHRFRHAWRTNPEALLAIVRRLGSQKVLQSSDVPRRFCVKRRVSLGRPRHYHYWTATDTTTVTMAMWTDEFLSGFIESVTAKPDGEAAPEILIIRSYPVRFVLDAANIASQLAADASEVEPFFDWVGEPFTGASQA
jgi:hypothetical protein